MEDNQKKPKSAKAKAQSKEKEILDVQIVEAKDVTVEDVISTEIKKFNLGCELLSFFSIFGIQNNIISFELQTPFVVNCFHFSVSLGYKTTINISSCSSIWL